MGLQLPSLSNCSQHFALQLCSCMVEIWCWDRDGEHGLTVFLISWNLHDSLTLPDDWTCRLGVDLNTLRLRSVNRLSSLRLLWAEEKGIVKDSFASDSDAVECPTSWCNSFLTKDEIGNYRVERMSSWKLKEYVLRFTKWLLARKITYLCQSSPV